MNFYEAKVNFKKRANLQGEDHRTLFPKEGEENAKKQYTDKVRGLNEAWGMKCDEKEAISIYIWEAGYGELSIIFAVDRANADIKDVTAYIRHYLEESYDVCGTTVTNVREITTDRFHMLGEKGDNNGYLRRFHSEENDLRIDYLRNREFTLKEVMISEEIIGYERAVEEAKGFMADTSFFEELERIYSDENEKKYYGNPVHYKISASNPEVAVEMSKLLVQALKSNHRLLGNRMSHIYEMKEGCYGEENLEHIVEIAQGNTVLLNLSGSAEEHGNYASAYENVIDFLNQTIQKNHVKTLFLFVEITEHPGFAEKLLARVAEEIDMISLSEGSGDLQAAIAYIEKTAKDAGYEISREEIEQMMPEKKYFTVGEAYGIYNSWFKNGLKNRIYKSYRDCVCMSVKKEEKQSAPYDELQKMIGLKEIKGVVDEVIDNARIQKLRSEMGMDSFKTSLHMVFTGNPGSAKTTVARLLAQIFRKEGILSTGKYVECGRADLVGKYVGWTAKTVRSKFREAHGGILFVDEAYSLVDDSNSFGDEAINTIVQEMENHRNDVIVIFAGYPEKMKTFLDKNEGLRSRIAFHLDFPDYNATEMTDILKLMAGQKGFRLEEDIEEKCYHIFEEACKQEEFGNGRYVRNLLEQAMMAQARRIATEYRGKKVSRKALSVLRAEDFDVNASKWVEKEKKKTVGFAV